MLPPAAFADPGVLRLGARARSSAAGSASATSRRSTSRAAYLMREIGPDSVVVIGGGGRPPARLPQRLPPPRRPDRRGRRGQRPAPAPLPVPRLVLRPRRRAARRPAHGRGRGLRPLLLRPAPGAARDRRRPGAGRPLRRRARPRASTSATWLGHLERYRIAEPRSAPARLDYEVAANWKGDRRELQRVPALPRRPPGAQRAQRLHERRGDRGRRSPGAAAR